MASDILVRDFLAKLSPAQRNELRLILRDPNLLVAAKFALSIEALLSVVHHAEAAHV